MTKRNLYLALIFTVFPAFPLNAADITFTDPATVAFTSVDFVEVKTQVSEQLQVTAPTVLTLTYSFPLNGYGPTAANCDFGLDNKGKCVGYDNDHAYIDGAFPYGEINFSGPYALSAGGDTNNRNRSCGIFGGSQCHFLLQPGIYTFTVSVYDQLGQDAYATALPFSEGLTGILHWNGPDDQVQVVVTPEPATTVVLLVPLGFGIFFVWRRPLR